MPPPPPPLPSSASSSAQSPSSTHKPARKPLSIDDVTIDFSAIATTSGGATAPTSAASGAIPGLLDIMATQQQQYDGDGGAQYRGGGRRYQGVSDVRAFDPGLQGVMQRYTSRAANAAGSVGGGPARRRKIVFGAQQQQQHASAEDPAPQTPSAAHSVEPAPLSSLEATQAALDFLVEAQQQQTSAAAVQQRRDAYLAQLRCFCQRGRGADGHGAGSAHAEAPATAFPDGSHAQTNSLLRQLFADGVPDIEPWDRWTSTMPRYGSISNSGGGAHLVVSPLTATVAQIRAAQLDLVHHPVIPDTHYTQHYEYRDLEHPVIQKEYKTKEQLRAERRERLKEKQARAQQKAAAAPDVGALHDITGSSRGPTVLASSAASRLLHDRLSTKNLALNLFGSSVLNPLATDTKVLEQYELRNLEHQRRNHDRHVAALPDQILKRARDQRRHATEAPLLRAYRVFPIFSAAHLGKLRNFANDNLLRGFVLYVGDCDAVIVLAGGEVAARHLDRWIMHKMDWEHPDTRAVRLCSVPLMDAGSFSFHLKKARGQPHKRATTAAGKRDGRLDDVDGDDAAEPVFINMVPTVEEAEAFLRRLPAPSSPWSDLCGVWRAAFLRDGLQLATGGHH
ncbi:conserved hypothetical protein [Leishmania major strain Friedlin]|uniref:Small nuclear ribonucleoprotein Prp3 C-terminal domain-containing protein n=1 Tax=Leishmania major TaxID=5664 RepID=E9AC47_LEIMA|nr:conserved hypothetical protein [Leishmania major strain Friedlin]CAG9567121.1 pre-mRNA_processing_factor_3_(PRP3)/Protein_of_unknown_function_(DUF1115)_-_putative [Leishmania major strain Friedlin]CBZ11861.1 conserved hypothetical protein [Leishmania major strain Friedlin]|eukprot:XP_003721578.1 conserved hypothetical protein [Leishmania major strain Friedlin]